MTLLKRLKKEPLQERSHSDVVNHPIQDSTEEDYELKSKLHEAIIYEYNQDREQNIDSSMTLESIIEFVVDREAKTMPRHRRERLISELHDDILGLGPLEKLLRNPEISEIMVNGFDAVYVEEAGRLKKSPMSFRDNEHIITIINRIVSPLGRRCDEANPMVDARLPNGSRVNAVLPPIALKGPTLTIRKFRARPLTIHDLINYKSLSPKMAAFLEACVRGHCNILVSGGTGSGKTTLLNVLSAFIPDTERIITIEDAAELQLMQDHVVSLESRPANIEGSGLITIRDMVRNALRMRPDRIIVGEVRSGEALDMLQAMNTGHDGSLATAHANTCRDAVSRLETMVLMAGMDLPVRAIREQIASALHIIVQQTRLRDGTRKIVSISEVIGMEGDIVTLQELFKFEQNKRHDKQVQGHFVSNEIIPHITGHLNDHGISIDEGWFNND